MPIIAGRASAAYGAGFGAVTNIYAGPFGAYDALASAIVPSGGLSSVTFAGIPTGYKHLQLRTFVQQASTGGYTQMILSGATFVRRHNVQGDGSAASSGSDTTNAPGIFSTVFSSGSSIFAANILDILDYNSTNNKVTRSLGGFDTNGGGFSTLFSSLYTSTSAVNSITLNAITQNFTEYTQFALYGVK
jgi:hypothetical protein